MGTIVVKDFEYLTTKGMGLPKYHPANQKLYRVVFIRFFYEGEWFISKRETKVSDFFELESIIFFDFQYNDWKKKPEKETFVAYLVFGSNRNSHITAIQSELDRNMERGLII